MTCASALKKYGLEGLIGGVLVGSAYALYKKYISDSIEGEFMRCLGRYVRDFGLAGLVIGLIYAAVMNCVDKDVVPV